MVFLVVFGLYLDPFLESGLTLKLTSRYCVLHWKQTVHLKYKRRMNSIIRQRLPRVYTEKPDTAEAPAYDRSKGISLRAANEPSNTRA